MKTIYRLAKTELSTLFYSPIAWLILVIFTFQAGMEFSELFTNQVRYQALGYQLNNVTYGIFGGMGGVFASMQGNLYLYIPLLTMGLMSREYSSGSIKLLYSSPVTNTQIILGKYLTVVIYGLLLVAILSVYVIFAFLTIHAMDLPMALSGLLALFLLTCAYAAIGLFMSTLTSYQVVAAMGTLALLAALNFIGDVGQGIPLVRDITYWLSIIGRANEMISGLLCSDDVIYFLVVILLFISLSILRLQSLRKKRPGLSILSRYAAVLVAALLVGYLSSRPALKFYCDVTATQRKTLTPASREVMEKMDGGLTITTYVNLLDDNYWKGMPYHVNFDMAQFKQYVRFKPELKMEYVYYYDHTANRSLDQRYPNMTDKERAFELMRVNRYDSTMFLTPDQIRKRVDLSGEDHRFVRILERSNGEKSVLRIFDDNQRDPSEAEITAAMKRMTVKPPRVGFVTGHGERDIFREGDKEYSRFSGGKTFRYSLINQGFDVQSVFLDRAEEIPGDIDILVVADARTPFSGEELAALKQYIERGGNLILAGEPGKQAVMDPVAEHLGVRFLPGQLMQESEHFSPGLIVGRITPEAAGAFPGYRYLYHRDYRFTFPSAVGLEYREVAGFRVMPLVTSEESLSWNEADPGRFRDDQPVVRSESKGPGYPLALYLSRQVGEKEQRILVFGDADCISNGELRMSRPELRSANYSLVTESFGTLAYGEFPVDTSRPVPPDNRVNMGLASVFWIKTGFIGVFPLILACWGIALWLRRRKK